MAKTQMVSVGCSQKLAYSVATFSNALVGVIISVFTFFFYKTVVYTDLITANEFEILSLLGTALAIGWWFQAIMNPVAGWLSDKFFHHYQKQHYQNTLAVTLSPALNDPIVAFNGKKLVEYTYSSLLAKNNNNTF
ncbi:MAG: hypothetical protein ACXADY_03200 [Candidatus Hodarchaeales archaeon]